MLPPNETTTGLVSKKRVPSPTTRKKLANEVASRMSYLVPPDELADKLAIESLTKAKIWTSTNKNVGDDIRVTTKKVDIANHVHILR